MKATELIIGDWVLYKNVPHKIHTLTAAGETRYETPSDLTELTYDDCKPIPLTKEILEKNRFKDYDEIKEYQFEENGERYRFYLKKMYKDGNFDCWGTNIGGVLPSLITYVHELQHALRLCGLTELADNFKID